ncbi:actin-depolymerizing factor 2 [Pocillopora verrucosa]|uniref:actin-depolymerizing factor 2 n=1 Tax=Pocillopora verrucosa TaxID=203993 RepID=UPI002796F861|nr:actin-depolymerizing factor 2-like [Pocillopora verrucosa]XP_058962192.1 actin-depolymerizing factor 2-like [Pocillopora verrucosa]
MASGIKLDESCKKMFSLVKDKHEHAWAIMKIDNDKEVVLTKQHGKLVSNTDLEENERLFEAMKGKVAELDGPCYILFDFVYQQKSGATKDKPIYIYWCDDDCVGVKEKMKYAATNSELKKQCNGFETFEFHDKDDFCFQKISNELKAKDRQ